MGLASDLKGHIRGVVIANEIGNFLVEAMPDKNYNSSLISAFVAGLAQLGRENLGKLHEISIKGEQMSLEVTIRDNLMMISIFDPNVDMCDIQEEGPAVLEYFYEVYKNDLENWDGNQEIFADFTRALSERIENLLKRTVQSKEALFTKLFSVGTNSENSE